MNITKPFSIIGVGKYLPLKCVSSAEIEKDLALDSGWVVQNIGVENRYWAEPETNTDMAIEALRLALDDSGIHPEEIDCLIAASATFDYIIPNRASMIKAEMPEVRNMDFPALDINTTCTSFITALDHASRLLDSDDFNKIAIVSSEISSKGISSEFTETYSLFGDAAVAVILSKSKTGGVVKHQLRTYSEGALHTLIEGGGNRNHARDVAYDSRLHSFQMDGKNLLRLAYNHLPDFIRSFYTDTSGYDRIIPHQASKLGLRLLKQLLPAQQRENVVDLLAQYGNCIAASLPLALVNTIQSGDLKEGQSCFLIGTGAGMSISGLSFIYSKL